MCKQENEETPVQTTADTENARVLQARKQIAVEVDSVFEYINEDEYDGYFEDMSASDQIKTKVSMIVAQEAVRLLTDEQLAELLTKAMAQVRKEMFGV